MDIKEIRQYVVDNNETELMPHEIDHVADGLEHIYRWYHEGYPLGSFLTAVINNDLMESVFTADYINIKALKIYAFFLTWKLPGDWREKAKC